MKNTVVLAVPGLCHSENEIISGLKSQHIFELLFF
jgi:hypothetical protein